MRLLIMPILAATIAISCKSNKTETYEAVEQNVERRSADRGDRTDRGDKKSRPSAEEIFKMDTNNDGLLSASEVANSPLSRNFTQIDSNNDGYISKEEFKNAPKPKKGQRPDRNNR